MAEDLPLQGLMQQMNAHSHSGEYLEVLGKRAAARWAEGAYKNLTEAVTSAVKEAQLSPEQVRRVVEFANTSAYLNAFKKEGAPHHVVDFPGGPADPAAILQDLNDGGGGTVYDRGTGDYNQPPSHAKVSSAKAEDELLALFNKTAEAGEEAPHAIIPYENPHGEVFDLKNKLAGAAAHLQSEISGLEVMYADVGDRVYQQTKQAALSGVSLGQVMQAWESVAPSADHIKVAFTLITPRLLREGVFYNVESMTRSVDKTASARIVNPEHPLVVEFADFCTVLTKMAELREARAEMQTHLRTLDNYIKAAAHPGGAVGKVWQLAGEAGEAISPFVRPVAGDAAAGLVKHLPRAALVGASALAANDLNQHVENSPNALPSAARYVKHKALEQVPGTGDYYNHLYRIQNGL